MTASTLPPPVAHVLAKATHVYQRHGSRLPGLASLLLVMVIAWQIGAWVWQWLPTPASARWTPAPAVAGGGAAKVAISGDALAAAHLFGQYQAVPTSTALASAPDTQLNLTLIGILAGNHDSESRALISRDNDDGAAYAIGSDVTPGTTLQAIFIDRVILSRNGRLETLRLDKDAPGKPLPPGSAAVTGEPEQGTPAAAQMLAQIRSQVLSDPSKAATYIRVQPLMTEGSLKGYRVYPGQERGAFNAAGLKPGDVVTSINGSPLSDPAQALQLLQSLSTAAQINLTVDRNGSTQSVSVSAAP